VKLGFTHTHTLSFSKTTRLSKNRVLRRVFGSKRHEGKDNVKVYLSLCLTKHHAMKTYWTSGGVAPRIHDQGTCWRSVISFTSRPLFPLGKCLGTRWIEGWVCLRAGLEAVTKGKKSHICTCRELNSGHPTPCLVTVLTDLPRLLRQEVKTDWR
jgi:hypothetical protein